MRLRTVIRPNSSEVAEAWERFYSAEEWDGTNKRQIARELRGLPHNAPREDIDAIIGNRSWTEVPCDSCREDVDEAIALDIGTMTVNICQPCWDKGSKLWLNPSNVRTCRILRMRPSENKKDPAAEAAG